MARTQLLVGSEPSLAYIVFGNFNPANCSAERVLNEFYSIARWLYITPS
jgi:hypothetical protein